MLVAMKTITPIELLLCFCGLCVFSRGGGGRGWSRTVQLQNEIQVLKMPNWCKA